MSVTTACEKSGPEILEHAWPVRLTHWLMAAAILLMIGSGWRIYNASPIFPFRFPDALTLGGDIQVALTWHNDPGVATAIAWHFAAMWLLAVSYLLFVAWGALSGHFRRDFLPVGPSGFLRDFIAAARFRLAAPPGRVQRRAKSLLLGRARPGAGDAGLRHRDLEAGRRPTRWSCCSAASRAPA